MAFVVITGTPISFNSIYTNTKIFNTIKFDYIKEKTTIYRCFIPSFLHD